MKQLLIALIVLSSTVACDAQDVSTSQPRTLPGGDTEAWFSPQDRVGDRIVAEIDQAKKSVRVQAYSFTSSKIEAALERAKERGAEVTVILDSAWRGMSPTVAMLLERAEILTLVDSAHAIAHNKIIIIDDAVVLTGSYNLSAAAERRNAENMVKLTHGTVAELYVKNFDEHAKHSTPLNPEEATTLRSAIGTDEDEHEQ